MGALSVLARMVLQRRGGALQGEHPQSGVPPRSWRWLNEIKVSCTPGERWDYAFAFFTALPLAARADGCLSRLLSGHRHDSSTWLVSSRPPALIN